MASLCFSERSARFRRPRGRLRSRWELGRALLALLAAAGLAATAPACVMVRPEERGYLADPAMTFGAESQARAHEEHVLTNREGSYGASSVTGGGCGCN